LAGATPVNSSVALCRSLLVNAIEPLRRADRHQRQSEERSMLHKVATSKTHRSFLVVPALLLFLLLVSYVSFVRMAQAGWWRAHTYQVLLETQALLTSLIDMETGVRGYVNTRNEQFLEPYKRGKTQFDLHWQEALRSTVDNPMQQERLRQLQSQQQTWFRYQEGLLNLRCTTADNSRVLEEFNTSALARKRLMDSMRETLEQVENTERALLKQRTAELEALNFWTASILLAGGILSVVLAGYLSSVVARNTRKLSAANRKLEEEAVERKRTAEALQESERRFRAIFNNAFQFSGLLAPDGTLLEANQTSLDFGGLTREQGNRAALLGSALVVAFE
jgi:CHASE3 domain sensor protein